MLTGWVWQYLSPIRVLFLQTEQVDRLMLQMPPGSTPYLPAGPTARGKLRRVALSWARRREVPPWAIVALRSSLAGAVSAREPAGPILPAMALSPFRDRLMRGYACTRTLDRQADSLRSRMADLASDPAAADDVLNIIKAVRETLDRAEQAAAALAAEQLPGASSLTRGSGLGPTGGR